MSKNIQMKILVGGNSVLLFLTSEEAKALETEIRKNKKEWLEVSDRTGKTFSLRSSLIGGYELITPKTKQLNNEGTIPIKKLADFAGVHPITITRNFANTLSQSTGKSKKFSRATKETALALFEYLHRNDQSLKKDRFLQLFTTAKT